MGQVLSVMDAFGELGDPRSRQSAHDLVDMLIVALAAILSGADTWVAIEVWGRAKLDWLRQYLPLRNGIASHDTFGRVFAALNSAQFEACFIRWVQGICPTVAGDVVAIDGKTVRGSRQKGARAIHLVSAYSSQLGLVLGQVRTADHSNEITAIPILLEALWLKCAIVTMDAMGCQRKIARTLIAGGADYVLAVKDNHRRLATGLRNVFEAFDTYADVYQEAVREHVTIGKGHGRIETRRVVVYDVTHWNRRHRWPGLRSIARVEATRDIAGQRSVEHRYYITSLPAEAAPIARAIRSHWQIENGMHWVLDMAFGEDQSRVRMRNAAQNFATLRRIAMNLLRRQDKASKVGLRTRRLKAGADDDYRAHLLGLAS